MASHRETVLSADKKAMLVSFAARGDMVAQAIIDGFNTRLVEGGALRTPTTASTQATGTGATAWRVNTDLVIAVVDGVAKAVDPQADISIHSATQYLVSGQSAVAAVVLKVAANGAASVIAVKGAAATTGAQVAPTDAAIQAAVGAGLSWLKLGEVTLNRTADTTVTQTQDNTKRDIGLVFA